MKSTYSIFIIFSLSLLFSSISSLTVDIDIKQYQYKCMGEYLVESTLALFKVNSPTSEIRVRLLDQNGNQLFNKEKESEVKIAYTPKVSGNHQICIDNRSEKEIRLEFQFKTGVSAKDYSSVAKQSNLKPMELNVRFLFIL